MSSANYIGFFQKVSEVKCNRRMMQPSDAAAASAAPLGNLFRRQPPREFNWGPPESTLTPSVTAVQTAALCSLSYC